jgi:hypothetical protein
MSLDTLQTARLLREAIRRGGVVAAAADEETAGTTIAAPSSVGTREATREAESRETRRFRTHRRYPPGTPSVPGVTAFGDASGGRARP